MKNLFFTVAAAVALTFALASCKKDRTCTCTTDDGAVIKIETKKVTKKGADCVSYTEVDEDGDTYTLTCDLD